jgi:N-methylhydantoinase A
VSAASVSRQLTIAVDTGGTFTDLVVADSERVLGLYKAPTTPRDLIEGITAALEDAAHNLKLTTQQLLQQTAVFVYSTTHSTNAILEGKTARTAFLTTRGHRDILLYKEGGKDQVHNWAIPFPKPYVPRSLTFEITERVTSDGQVLVALDDEELEKIIERLGELEVEAVGVCLLWASLNPEHELRIGERLATELPAVAVSLSHRVNRIIREYRRASATVIDASLKPLMRRHLESIEQRLRELGFRGEPLMVTHVSGGVLELAQMIEQPIQTVDSGPALAPIAGREFDRAEPAVDTPDVIVVDTGGTSFDASLVISGEVAYTREKWFGPRWYGHMTGLPAVDTRSIGAGGGSIAHVDAGGLVRVGPESAGAEPGPACYGRGGKNPTVTDAALLLGYLDPENFLGGRMQLDAGAARDAIEREIAGPLGKSAEEASEAIMTIASEEMRGLLTELTITQGRDARQCLLVAGGGAAGLNICRIAREADISHVIVPRLAGGLSALGGLFSDIMSVFSRGVFISTARFDFAAANEVLASLRADMDRFFSEVALDGTRSRKIICEARYAQEMWEIEVPLGDRESFSDDQDIEVLQRDFDAIHLDLFATEQPGAPVEIVTWRGEARVARAKPALAEDTSSEVSSKEHTLQARSTSHRLAWFDGAAVNTAIYTGADIPAGCSLSGPAIVTEPTTTLVIPPGVSVLARPSHYLVKLDEHSVSLQR